MFLLVATTLFIQTDRTEPVPPGPGADPPASGRTANQRPPSLGPGTETQSS